MTEAELQATIVEVAQTFGWLVFHDRDSRTNASGFPDLVLVKRPRVLLVELKAEKGRLNPDQRVWIDELSGCDTIASGVIRPADLDRMLATLRSRR